MLNLKVSFIGLPKIQNRKGEAKQQDSKTK